MLKADGFRASEDIVNVCMGHAARVARLGLGLKGVALLGVTLCLLDDLLFRLTFPFFEDDSLRKYHRKVVVLHVGVLHEHAYVEV